jgi:hypothetical protein
MRLNVKAVAITLGLVWGGAMFFVLTANWLTGGAGGYAEAFINVMASVYPGLSSGAGVTSVIVGTLYGALDGAIGGAIVAWLYNKVLDRTTAAT